MRIEENKPLARQTTLGIGGPARWFVEAHSELDVAESAGWARESGVPLFVLGGGSNLLVADAGFPGLILHVVSKGIERRDDAGGEVLYSAAAGEDWDQFVERTLDNDCAGLECLAGIPGTVGGTPVQNVGAYGQEVSTTIDSVRAFDLQKHKFVEFSNKECGFSYRRSRFNSYDRGRFIVTRVEYLLKQDGAPTLKYSDLQRQFDASAKPSLREVGEAVRRIRRSKGMLLVDGDPDCRSAGSFFKNPIVTAEHAADIADKVGEEPPNFPAGPDKPGQVKLPAAWLIERAGFARGYALGRAGISTRHTLALVNRGGATATEILALADKIKHAVTQRFGVDLEIEPVLLGF
ncbi:UDP-N-acetylmuramate dehydrogenase [Telmatobacter sp. DSM 110680]|uniref:UDP-N-acetylenolpyruvoylglucosamine reductase n=1 Tax=Telmatobacter sp. DSM 110680 TaxID=3036704 RepID=A0AAU7DFA0_9BACT